MHSGLLWAALAAVGLALGGCEGMPCHMGQASGGGHCAMGSSAKAGGDDTGSAAATAASGGVVNTRCPIMGNPVNPAKVPQSLTREYNGQKVGFCCGGCPGAWDRLSTDQKDAKLKAAGAAS